MAAGAGITTQEASATGGHSGTLTPAATATAHRPSPPSCGSSKQPAPTGQSVSPADKAGRPVVNDATDALWQTGRHLGISAAASRIVGMEAVRDLARWRESHPTRPASRPATRLRAGPERVRAGPRCGLGGNIRRAACYKSHAWASTEHGIHHPRYARTTQPARQTRPATPQTTRRGVYLRRGHLAAESHNWRVTPGPTLRTRPA